MFEVDKSRTTPNTRRLHDDGDQNSLAIGCHSCPDLNTCGGLRIMAATFSCFDRCCGALPGCDAVCLGKPETFTDRVREVGGFDLTMVPPTHVRSFPTMPFVVPIVYGGASRAGYGGNTVALPLAKMIRRDGSGVRFNSSEEMASEFHFVSGATVVLTGTDEDKPLERWWNMQTSGRRAVARSLVSLGVRAATSPNFSMFTDRPRHDDLHAAKRIAIAWQEMMDEGLATALHVNARTEADWLRWTSFVAARPEIQAVAYEFATPGRPNWHAQRLMRLAQDVGRPLRLLVRGGRVFLPALIRAFDSVTILDTATYQKTLHRQKAEVRSDGSLGWQSIRTAAGDPLDDLFEHNLECIAADVLKFATAASGQSCDQD